MIYDRVLHGEAIFARGACEGSAKTTRAGKEIKTDQFAITSFRPKHVRGEVSYGFSECLTLARILSFDCGCHLFSYALRSEATVLSTSAVASGLRRAEIGQEEPRGTMQDRKSFIQDSVAAAKSFGVALIDEARKHVTERPQPLIAGAIGSVTSGVMLGGAVGSPVVGGLLGAGSVVVAGGAVVGAIAALNVLQEKMSSRSAQNLEASRNLSAGHSR